jgi:hypothetical protein
MWHGAATGSAEAGVVAAVETLHHARRRIRALAVENLMVA